jgi:hypothetical protein
MLVFYSPDSLERGWNWRSWTLVSFAVYFLWLFFLHSHTYIQQIHYVFPGKYYRRQHRIWVEEMLLVADKYSEIDPVPCSIDDLSVTEIRDELRKK